MDVINTNVTQGIVCLCVGVTLQSTALTRVLLRKPAYVSSKYDIVGACHMWINEMCGCRICIDAYLFALFLDCVGVTTEHILADAYCSKRMFCHHQEDIFKMA